MFENLSEKLQKTFRNLTGQGRVSEAILQESLREIRLAMLEADVAVPVVRTLIEQVRAKALGEEVLRSLTPGQQVMKVVRGELLSLLGAGSGQALRSGPPYPAVIVMAGLQGSGKTTTTAKLAHHLKKLNRTPLVVPVDVSRPAAIEQLLVIARQAGVPAFPPEAGQTPLQIARAALARARQSGHDTLLVDTAGRLHIDDELMTELQTLKSDLSPVETLYVADAMTGQDAVRSAAAFHERVGLTGVVLSKMDGDARGGAALSVAAVTGVPVKFVGTGEGIAALEAFDPGRMAGRILGMGDVIGLIEKAESAFEADEAKALEKKLRRSEFTLEDFRDQLKKLRRMGSLTELLGMLPGGRALAGAPEVDPAALARIEAIIGSMTPAERRDHTLLNGSRKKRIARGSGTSVTEINGLVRQFAQMKKMMKSIQGMRPGRMPAGILRRS